MSLKNCNSSPDEYIYNSESSSELSSKSSSESSSESYNKNKKNQTKYKKCKPLHEEKSDHSESCQQGEKGENGEKGEKGEHGEKGDENETSYLITLSSQESVNSNDYIGTCSSSNNILRNTIVIPINMIIKKMTFSIRTLADNVPYIATLYINGSSTSLSTIIPNGSLSYSSSSSVSFQVNQEDLLTVFVNWTGGALSNCVTISFIAEKI